MSRNIQKFMLRCPKCKKVARTDPRYNHIGYDVQTVNGNLVECRLCHHRWRSRNAAQPVAQPTADHAPASDSSEGDQSP